ncbi:MAG: hypothetical protein ACOX0A_04740 [Thermoguttaceae bacterium]|jgi:hypothetical protein
MKSRRAPVPNVDDNVRSVGALRFSRRCSILFRGVMALLPIALLIAFFLPSADSSARFAYRDVAYYYYPLFEQIQTTLEAGQAPFWNPYINLGQPLAGDPTSSVFYPGKAIFFLSSLGICSYPLCFKLYLWLHAALAFYCASRLSRALGVSRIGATISGLAYAFSGQVLFQYTNVIYLVGAAWAPLHFAYALEFFKGKTIRRRLLALVKLSVVLALAILGGEPQIAYLSLLATTVIAFFTRKGRQEPHENKQIANLSRIKLVCAFFLGTSLLTGVLAAVQILPSLEVVARSTRADADVRSLWELPGAYWNARAHGQANVLTQKEFYNGLLCQDFSSGGRSSSIYRFSVGPWRWLEFLFPCPGGREYPQSARWFSIFPEELSLWTPTLYFGIVPCILAFAAMRLRRRHSERYSVAATWLALFGLLGAMGGYGLVWLLRFIVALTRGEPPSDVFCDGDPIGGLYWFLNLIVPKFAEFRYPAKLLTLSAIGFSALAGIGWDSEKYSQRFKRIALAVLILASSGVLFIASFGDKLFNAIQTPPNPLFGPFQPELARKFTLNSCLHTMVVVLVALALLAIMQRATKTQTGAQRSLFLSLILLFAIGADLFVANRWLIVTAPEELFSRASSVAEEALRDGADAEFNAQPPLRVYRYPIWFPPVFQSKSSPRRLSERVIWDVETLYPLYPASKGIAMLDARGAVMESEFAKFLDKAILRSKMDADLAFLDVRYVLGPQFWTQRISPSPPDQNDDSYHDWRLAIKKIDASPSRAILARDGGPVPRSEKDRVDIISYTPNEIVMLATASESSELIVSEQFWQDWKLKLTPISEEIANELYSRQYQFEELASIIKPLKSSPDAIDQDIKPAFGFLRRGSVPRGQFCAFMTYSPRKLYYGACVSALAWAAALGTISASYIRRRGLKNKRMGD